MQKRLGTINRTFTGKDFDFLRPNPDLICIEDIAHHLSMITRYSGSPKYYYSVAEHSYWASKICAPEFAFMILLHDAAESYLNDITSPLKNQLPVYKLIENNIMEKVWWHFGIWIDNHLKNKLQEVQNRIDHIMFLEENIQILNHPYEYDFKGNKVDNYKPTLKIECWHPARAESLFLNRFNELKS